MALWVDVGDLLGSSGYGIALVQNGRIKLSVGLERRIDAHVWYYLRTSGF